MRFFYVTVLRAEGKQTHTRKILPTKETSCESTAAGSNVFVWTACVSSPAACPLSFACKERTSDDLELTDSSRLQCSDL